MKLTIDEDLLEAARKTEPVIREHGAAAEAGRRLPRPVWDAMAEAGLLRLYVPKSLGGLETDPLTFARVVEEVSSFDSAAGWAVTVANAGAWWVRHLPTEGTEEIYADGPDGFIAGAFHPPVMAVETDGGYRLTGQAPLASHIHDASWALLLALVCDGDQPRMTEMGPEVIAAVFRANDAEILDTWQSLGMRATDSNDIAVHGLFVPTARTTRLSPEFEPGAHHRGPLYRAPAFGPVLAAFVPVGLAIARGCIDELRAVAAAKTPFNSTTPLRERAAAQAKVGLAEATLRSARTHLYDTIADAWERTLAGAPSSLEQRADLLLAATHALQSSATTVELCCATAGTTAVYQRNAMERHFRDIETLRHHGFVSASRYETAGQVYLGLPPDLSLVVF
jgi:alkylation response protein AidB-like acyl-CoA dehydrogenase